MTKVVTAFHVLCLLEVLMLLTNFRKALELLRLHADRIYHKTAVLSLEGFQKVMINAQPSITHQHLNNK